ncbi:hypothetical protein Mterra_04085 [Calidithermus terrae]|uniref:Uncharacterized protein n=1 Tax=Calidithermus terrae TaxID=1408545 RepID=A0A399DTA7_9DEIN|nr:hypothetical protein Mterra_04085 [Calidithermus terrae]
MAWPPASSAARMAATMPSTIPLGATRSAPAWAWETTTLPSPSSKQTTSPWPSRLSRLVPPQIMGSAMAAVPALVPPTQAPSANLRRSTSSAGVPSRARVILRWSPPPKKKPPQRSSRASTSGSWARSAAFSTVMSTSSGSAPWRANAAPSLRRLAAGSGLAVPKIATRGPACSRMRPNTATLSACKAPPTRTTVPTSEAYPAQASSDCGFEQRLKAASHARFG